MFLDPNDNHLSSLIDELRHGSSERITLVDKISTKLNDADWYILSAWDVGATYCPFFGRLELSIPREIQVLDSWGNLFIMASLLKSKDYYIQPSLIEYQMSDYVVVIDRSSPNIPSTQVIHNPRSLLIAMQLIRDELDSVLLDPPDLRNAQITSFSTTSEIGEEYFRRLITWFPAVEGYLKK
jgi:hypothetical protein